MSSENFSSKYTKIEDIPVDDMHALLFGCSETWGNKRRLGHLSREQLLTVIEYVTGQRRTDALIDRNRDFAARRVTVNAKHFVLNELCNHYGACIVAPRSL